MGCAQSTRVTVVEPAELTAHEKLLARNQQVAERKELARRPLAVQPARRSPAWSEDSPSSEAPNPGSPPPLADDVCSWRSGPDAELVYKAGTLSLYTQGTSTWESAFFELAQWSGDGQLCLRSLPPSLPLFLSLSPSLPLSLPLSLSLSHSHSLSLSIAHTQ